MVCEYCQKQKDVLYENKGWVIILDSNQAYLGRCRIIVKRHVENLSDLNSNEWKDFSEIVNKMELAFRKTFDATMFNWNCFVNDSYLNSPQNPHIHWHIRPRYNHEVKFSGLIFKDEEFGHVFDRTKKMIVSEEVLKKIAKKIKENF